MTNQNCVLQSFNHISAHRICYSSLFTMNLEPVFVIRIALLSYIMVILNKEAQFP